MALPSVFVVGDSIGDPVFLGYDAYPERLTGINLLDNISDSGDKLTVEIEPFYSDNIAVRGDYSIAIIQGGVNDSVSATLADTKTALTNCVASANALGKDVFVLSIAPWKNSASWTAGRQTFTDDYNTWLAAQASVQGFTFVDVYTPLEDPANADELLPAYDSGDAIHPSAAGATAMAVEVQTAIDPFLIDAPETNIMNELKLWRGAVEPAETGASGNEIRLWRGAVEPSSFLLGFNDASLRHNTGTYRHLDQTLRHKDTTLDHNR